MTLSERCTECGLTFRQHRRHHRLSVKRARTWYNKFKHGMGKIARESKGSKRPEESNVKL